MTVGLIVWCLITIKLEDHGEMLYTSAKGRVTRVTDDKLFVDFSEYARKQKYIGEYYNVEVDQDECTKE